MKQRQAKTFLAQQQAGLHACRACFLPTALLLLLPPPCGGYQNMLMLVLLMGCRLSEVLVIYANREQCESYALDFICF